MSKGDFKYSTVYGFPPPEMPTKRKRRFIYDDDEEKTTNRVVKKVKVTVPALEAEKIFKSVKECAQALCIETSVLYAYIKRGWASRGMLRFEYVE